MARHLQQAGSGRWMALGPLPMRKSAAPPGRRRGRAVPDRVRVGTFRETLVELDVDLSRLGRGDPVCPPMCGYPPWARRRLHRDAGHPGAPSVASPARVRSPRAGSTLCAAGDVVASTRWHRGPADGLVLRLLPWLKALHIVSVIAWDGEACPPAAAVRSSPTPRSARSSRAFEIMEDACCAGS